MKNLKILFKRPLQAVPNNLAVLFLIVAAIGFVDASFLAIEYYQGVIPPCSIGGCDVVLTSPYSKIFGIPIALIGALYYLIISAGLFAYLESANLSVLKTTLLLTGLGFLSTLWLLFLQAFVLESYCVYCLVSALTSILLFVGAIFVLNRYGIDNQNLE